MEQQEYPQYEGIEPIIRPQADVIEALTDLTPTLILIEHTLKGEYFNETKKQWEIIGKTLANDTGIKRIMTELISILNKNVVLSAFEDEEINGIMLQTMDAFAILLRLKRDDFGIDKSDLDSVANIVETNLWAGLKRAGSAQTLRAVTTTIMEKRLVQSPSSQTQKKGGSFPFNIFKRGE